MYFKNPAGLSQVEEELAEGLAMLFSTQLELGEAELQSKLLKDAEIKALQAQVNPHFYLMRSIRFLRYAARMLKKPVDSYCSSVFIFVQTFKERDSC